MKVIWLIGVLALALSGCNKGAPATEHAAAEKPAAAAEEEEGVTLKPEEVGKLGIATTAAQAITSSPEVPGFAVVLAHEIVAAPVAELHTAVAAARQSRSALERSRRLAGTPGAMPADTQETAERQAVADEAALELVRQRLSSTFGQNPPWKDPQDSPVLMTLANGHSKLVRLTFPLGSLGDTTPASVRLAHIDSAQGTRSWQSQSVWRAPADAAVPGRSFFAILKDSEASEGDHLLAWAPLGAAEPGVQVPAAAVVISAGKFWCYVEEKPGTFVRKEIDPGRPVADGYFVKEGIAAGDKIVTSAAGQLLARETNPSTEAE